MQEAYASQRHPHVSCLAGGWPLQTPVRCRTLPSLRCAPAVQVEEFERVAGAQQEQQPQQLQQPSPPTGPQVVPPPAAPLPLDLPISAPSSVAPLGLEWPQPEEARWVRLVPRPELTEQARQACFCFRGRP